ncbi:MAG TPA: S8 family serine peptidase [Bacilli bacterium]
MQTKIWILAAAALAVALILIPRQNGNPRPHIAQTAEHSRKMSLLEQDVAHTDRLCRIQCARNFRQALSEMGENSGTETIARKLENMLRMHRHMQMLIYSKRDEPFSQGVKAVQNEGRIEWNKAAKQISRAKEIVNRGKMYQSKPLRLNGATYFVLGVPSRNADASLIGLIKQDIIDEVRRHQRKNLRLIALPGGHAEKLETVDSDTLRGVKVKSGDDNGRTSHFHQYQVVVKFRSAPTPRQLARIHQDLQATHVKRLGYAYVFESRKKTAREMLEYFRQWDVEYAEPHFFYMTNDQNDGVFVPNDVLYSEFQWNLPLVDTEQGWRVNRGSKDVIVGIVDTGVDPRHPDLRGHLLPGVNVVDEQKSPLDDVGHGTHVAGIISAVVNNGEGVAGMTWRNPILPVKVLDQSGSGSTYSVAQGIIWAADHGAKVINMSLGNYASSRFLHDAIRYAFAKDVVLIAASGNDNTEKPGYPAAYPEVLAVSAIDFAQQRAPFSNYGDYIDVVAPGVSIASTFPQNRYAALSGTSMASPHVAALAALIRSTNPKLSNVEVMDIIRKTAQDLGAPGKDKYYGYGQIDVARALKRAQGNDRPLVHFWTRLFERLLD